MSVNDCLEVAIEDFAYKMHRAFSKSQHDELFNKDQHLNVAKAMIKIAGLNIKACSVYGKLGADEVIYNIKKITDIFYSTCSRAGEEADLDAAINEISDIGTYIIGMNNSGLTDCVSN